MDGPYGPARGFGFLMLRATEARAVNVVKVTVQGGSCVPLLTRPDVAAMWIAALGRDGIDAEVTAAATNDQLMSWLVDLRDIGVTHVAFDPHPGNHAPDLIPIATAIIGFGMHE
jgi:hypothetical protein